MFPSHFYYIISLSNVKKKLSNRIWILLDSLNSLLNLISPLITTIIGLSSISWRVWSLGLESFWIPLTLCSIYVPFSLLLWYVVLQCQEEIEHIDWNPFVFTLLFAQFMCPFHFYYNMPLSNVKKKLSTGMEIFLDSPSSLLNLWSPVFTTITCPSPMSGRNRALGLESV